MSCRWTGGYTGPSMPDWKPVGCMAPPRTRAGQKIDAGKFSDLDCIVLKPSAVPVEAHSGPTSLPMPNTTAI